MEIEVIFSDKRGILMHLTESFYKFALNIKNFSVTELENGLIKDTFTLETEDDDYYIFERLEQRLKFEIPEIKEINLLSLQ